jgi:hypothetical protein
VQRARTAARPARGPLDRDHRIHDGLQFEVVVAVGRGDAHGQRQAVTVAHRVDLAAGLAPVHRAGPGRDQLAPAMGTPSQAINTAGNSSSASCANAASPPETPMGVRASKQVTLDDPTSSPNIGSIRFGRGHRRSGRHRDHGRRRWPHVPVRVRQRPQSHSPAHRSRLDRSTRRTRC